MACGDAMGSGGEGFSGAIASDRSEVSPTAASATFLKVQVQPAALLGMITDKGILEGKGQIW